MVSSKQNPEVSVIIPCYNEALTIRDTLEAIKNQTFAAENMEIVIADGMSSDKTRSMIHQFSCQHPEMTIRVIDNPERAIPAALNHAIRAARGKFIVRLDGHSAPDREYILRSIEAIKAGKGDNVGGVWDIKPGKNPSGGMTWISKSIAAAASNPIGVGNALYRYASEPQFVDTVPFGSFRKDLVKEVGFFNEQLLTNEDYEFNVRIVQSGGKIWLDPRIRSIYFARSTFRDLIRQYWRYGFWKTKMLIHFPGSLRWRQALPPLFISSVMIFALASIWFYPAIYLLMGILFIYLAVLLSAAVGDTHKNRELSMLVGVPIAIACMHFSWGLGFLYSLTSTFLGNLFKRK